MIKSILGFALIIAMVYFSSCDKNPQTPPEEDIDYSQITDIHYSEHVQPLLNKRCGSCHGPQNAQAGLKMDSWFTLVAGSDFGEAIIPFNSERSRMILMLTRLAGTVHPVDRGALAVETDEIDFLARWIDEGARNDDDEIPYDHPHGRVYVCNQNDPGISIIDPHALVVTRYINLRELGYPANSQPHMVAISPDGEYWYVSLIGANKVLKFDAHSDHLLGEITVTSPALLEHHPGENVLYVSRFLNFSEPFSSIFAVNTENMLPADGTDNGNIPLLPNSPVPHALTMDENFIYTASLPEDLVIAINHQTKEVYSALHLGDNKGPLHLTLSPDNQTLYASCITSDEMAVIDVRDPAAMAVVNFIPTGADPWHPHVDHHELLLYVGNNASNNFSVIDTQTHSMQLFGAGNGSDGLSLPHGVAIDEYIFFTNQNNSGAYVPRHDFGDNDLTGTVVVVNKEDFSILKVIEVGKFATGIMVYHED